MAENDERTFNIMLAEVLRTKNPEWRKTGRTLVAEASSVLKGRGTPDILISKAEDAPIVVETEYLPAREVEKDAKSRLGGKTSETGKTIKRVVALRAPKALKSVEQARLKQAIEKATYEYCLLSAGDDSGDPLVRWPATGWLQGSVDDLADLIENAFLSEQVIAKSLDTLEKGVGAAAGLLRQALKSKPAVNEKIAEQLHQKDGVQTTRMAMAIAANALIFQGIIAGTHDVKTIAELRTTNGVLPSDAVLKEWQRILYEINYWPIFDIASKVMKPIPASVAAKILDNLADVANELAAIGVTQSHDLSGRMFQRLISDRKFLATFYTLPESASLLAELAVGRLEVDWRDANAIKALRIADLSCGTGALLSAAYHAVLARHRRAGGSDSELHRPMMEKSLIATDIMPAATHLTTSILSSTHPRITFHKTQIHVLPYGKPPERGDEPQPLALGALDLIEAEHATDLFVTTGIRAVGGRGEHEVEAKAKLPDFELKHRSCDLVIMNPPFTRPTGHESAKKIGVPVPSFAGFNTSDDEQRVMSQRLQKMQSKIKDTAGHGNAGLASNFLDLANIKLKPGGILAMVVPASLTQGRAWKMSRELLDQFYDDITVVSLATTGATMRAFSADTGMAEALVIGKKRETKRIVEHATVRFASLQSRPKSVAEAVVVAQGIINSEGDLLIGDTRAGAVMSGTLHDGGMAGVGDPELVTTCKALENGSLALPGAKRRRNIPIAEITEIGKRGFYHMDINGMQSDGSPRGPFDIGGIHGQPTWPCLWGHDAERERCLVVHPDRQGTVRAGMEKKAQEVWKTASRLHFNRDFRLNSQSLAACVTPKPAIGGRAWPNFIPEKTEHEHAIVLWANTTLGIMLFWWCGSRQQQGRAILTITELPKLPVLDTRKLSATQHKQAKEIFQRFKKQEFLPANEAYRDETRQSLDRAVLVELLGLPQAILEPLDLLRRKWCAEPSVHGGKHTRIPNGNG